MTVNSDQGLPQPAEPDSRPADAGGSRPTAPAARRATLSLHRVSLPPAEDPAYCGDPLMDWVSDAEQGAQAE